MDATESGTWQADLIPDTPASPVPPVQAAVSRVSRVSRLTIPRTPRPALQGLLAFAIYLAVFIVVYALPLISHLNLPNLRQYWTDPNFYTWAMQLVALCRITRHQPAVLEPDRGADGLQPGVGDHHSFRGPADVAGHGHVRRGRGVQHRAAARARRFRPWAVFLVDAPADRPVLGRAAGGCRLRLLSLRAGAQLAGPAEPHGDRAASR